MSNRLFMYPNEIVDQMILGDVVGTFVLWHYKYLKTQQLDAKICVWIEVTYVNITLYKNVNFWQCSVGIKLGY